ncbi:multiple sugar transport system substrate-binding protein [Neorhizobium sp. 2083]|uniref:ABC transporter substrate-binding protein n=1 Tax=Neorhizobium sp. 2083 TaxID=2817762 RepID=UPI002866C140|nr:ABC transporter substrate-binding protein [Neorhizobium sp. 2083]MDR6817426.1 multiple sugar transport system substrate-binding protein [Neorhizobium sp. 2083]
MQSNRHDLLSISRRQLLAAGGAAAAYAALRPSGAMAAGETIRFGIFGNAEKLAIRGKAIARYAELNPHLKIVYEGVPSDSWPDKIAAMVAGGNAPDVITMGYDEFDQYAKRGAIAPLEEYVPSVLRANLFDDAVLRLGYKGGKLMGVPIAVSIQALCYNKSALERLKMGTPPEKMNYKEFAKFCTEIHKANGKLYGSHDMASRVEDFQMYLIAQGKQMYNGEMLGVTADDVAEWLDIWDQMRKTGAAVPADVQAQFTGNEWPNSPMVRGTAVFARISSQDLAGGYQALTKDELNLMTPVWVSDTTGPGYYPRPTSCLSLNAKSANKAAAVKLIDWFVSDPESAKILGLVSGPPASRPALETVLAIKDLTPVDQKVLKYSQVALAKANKEPQTHRAQRAINDLMRRTNESVGFGSSNVKDAAQSFIAQATAVLKRA